MQTKIKKRKLKRGFKIFLWFFIFAIIVFSLFFLNYKRVIDLNIAYKDTKNTVVSFFQLFKKMDVSSTMSESPDEDLNDFSELFKARLSSKGLEFASSSVVEPNGDMKIYINNTHNDLGYIYVSTKDRAEYVWITFVSAIDAEPLKSKIVNNLNKLEYIDLRFGNKIFYKFNDGMIDISTSTAFKTDLSKRPNILSASSSESFSSTSVQNIATSSPTQ